VLVVWRHVFEQTSDGAEGWGERVARVRHEDLCRDPVAQLARIYGLLDRDLPKQVARWARGNVTSHEGVIAPDDSRWDSAFAAVGMEEALREAGYAT
jgi:hypothetical protein